ncbi:nitrate reductase subunit beta [Arthrobacter sp. G119Y2]|uniref:nitrate reductase subunit beta n=1 Tax=Arthrobacter sp. G119Y2 TaxID=3134965 RepID=UPI0031195F09
MRIMAQTAMVMALDKCIGCHTCSVTCKQAWTNRAGTEYVWFNNVETRPGQGYPRRYEDQEKWKGGWELNSRGKLKLKAGGRLAKLFGIFASPVQPELNDYYEPWTYDYENLINAPAGNDFPVAKPKSLITGEDMKITWSANWDDNLGGSERTELQDPVLEKMRRESEEKVKLEFDSTFMFYLPRICEHCLNPSCMASCPSGAIYKREEDGIVLVDQDRCRGWRQCVTGCPYKKMYFNHRSGKAEKCTFCYPRIEVGIPTVCAETCVGRLRYIGIFLYDADRVTAAASVPNEQDLYEAQLDLMMDPNDPDVIAAARAEGIPEDWLDAARRSPVYALAKEFRVALPLHPEYRTMPMVWYVPPLSPIVDVLKEQGHDGESADNLFGAIEALRIPVEYLAELFTAGDTDLVTGVLRKLAAMRAYMRSITLGDLPDEKIASDVGMTGEQIVAMYRLMAVAKYEERYVIPSAHLEDAHNLEEIGCSLDVEGGPGMGQTGVFGEASGRPMPVAAENFAALQARQRGEDPTGNGDLGGRVNLLNWDGRGSPKGLFPADNNRGAPGTVGGSPGSTGDGKGAVYDQAEGDGPQSDRGREDGPAGGGGAA